MEAGTDLAPPASAVDVPSRASSKYDFVKVRVTLSETPSSSSSSSSLPPRPHVYVLSRYLLSRMLTMIEIPSKKSVHIALQLKKNLVDKGLLTITQETLEKELFAALAEAGFPPSPSLARYRRIQALLQERVPLVIAVIGSLAARKSGLATQLGSRLNFANIIQTDVLFPCIMSSRAPPPAALSSSSSSSRLVPPRASDLLLLGSNATEESLLKEYREQSAHVIHTALAAELEKSCRDGKPTLLEGMHLDPSLLLSRLHPQLAIVREVEGMMEEMHMNDTQPPPSSSSSSADVLKHRNGFFLPVVLTLHPRDRHDALRTWYDRHVSHSTSSESKYCSWEEFQQRYEWLDTYLVQFAREHHLLVCETSLRDDEMTSAVEKIQHTLLHTLFASM